MEGTLQVTIVRQANEKKDGVDCRPPAQEFRRSSRSAVGAGIAGGYWGSIASTEVIEPVGYQNLTERQFAWAARFEICLIDISHAGLLEGCGRI